MKELINKLEEGFANNNTTLVLDTFYTALEIMDLWDELVFSSGISKEKWDNKLETFITIGEFKVLINFFNLKANVKSTLAEELQDDQPDELEKPVFSTEKCLLRHRTEFSTDFWCASKVTFEHKESIISCESESILGKHYDAIKETVVGQDEALKQILFNIETNINIINHNALCPIKMQKRNVLIQGGTGTGKTFMIQKVADQLKLPLVQFNCAELTAAGFVGKDTDDVIRLLSENGESMQILFLDEFDKLCVDKDTNKAIHTFGGQRALLKILESALLHADQYNINKGLEPSFDMSNVVIILGGAFAAFEESQLEEKSKQTIGFGERKENKEVKDISEEMLVKAGIIPEIAGRIGQVVRLNKLDKKALRSILLDSKEAVVKQFKMLARYKNKKFSLTEGEIDEIIEESMKLNLGVRGLSTLAEKKFVKQMLN